MNEQTLTAAADELARRIRTAMPEDAVQLSQALLNVALARQAWNQEDPFALDEEDQ